MELDTLLPVLSGQDKYHAHAFQPCRQMPSEISVISSESAEPEPVPRDVPS